MLKKILVAIVLVAVVIAGVLYAYRYTIIRYYAEKLIRENLPGYIKIESIDFDFANNRFSVKNFKVLNPPGFSSEFLVKIDSISYAYSIMGSGMPSGIEIKDVVLNGIDLRIERLPDGQVNMAQMDRFVQSFPSPSSLRGPPLLRRDEAISKNKIASLPAVARNDNLASIVKLPVSYNIKSSKLVFIDKLPYRNPYIITIGSVNGDVSINFADNYSRISGLSFVLSGYLNGFSDQMLHWTGSLNPSTPRLTMSNRFDVSDLEILTFEPYYDGFSPLVFRRGRISGTMVFDFNNGEIGSTNEIYLSNIAFSVKKGYENAQIWGTTVPDLIRYFTTTSGDIVFDFKLKGDMAKPTFYLGPISKRAITSMVVDKVASYAIEQATKQSGGKDVDKAKEAIDMVRQFLKK